MNYIFSRQNGGKRHCSWLCLTSDHCPLLSFCSSFSVLRQVFSHWSILRGGHWRFLEFTLPDSQLHPINSGVSWVPAVSSLPTSQPRNFLKGKTGAIMGLTLHFFPFLEFITLPHLRFNILKALSHIFCLVFQLIQMGGGRKVWEGGDICIPMVRSCWCRAERTQYCKATILQLKIHIFLKRKTKSIPCFTVLTGSKSPITCISIFLC